MLLTTLFSVSSQAAEKTAEAHLAKYNVSMQVARDFIMGNLNDLSLIYNTCKTFSVNNDMIAEIIASDLPGYTGTNVKDFFDANGFDGSTLGFNAGTGTTSVDALFQNAINSSSIRLNLDIGNNFSLEAAEAEEASYLRNGYTFLIKKGTTRCTSYGFTRNSSFEVDFFPPADESVDYSGGYNGILDYYTDGYNDACRETSYGTAPADTYSVIGYLIL